MHSSERYWDISFVDRVLNCEYLSLSEELNHICMNYLKVEGSIKKDF